VVIIIGNTYEPDASTSFTTIEVTTTVSGKTTTYATVDTTTVAQTTAAPTTSVIPPLGSVTTSVSGGVSANSGSNGSFASATPSQIPFTGNAPENFNMFYGTAVGCVAGLAAILLL
jgi:hypothetical protein